MKRRISIAQLIIVLMPGLMFAGAAKAEQLTWHSYNLVNVPLYFQMSTGSTTANISMLGSVNTFPVALSESPGQYSVYAEVDVAKDQSNRLAVNTNTSVWMLQGPVFGGAWANANAFLSATFELVAGRGDPAFMDKNIIVEVSGTYDTQYLNLIDGGNTIPLNPGNNVITLELGKVYTLKGLLYTVSSFVGNNVTNAASATMRVTVSD